MADTHVEHLGVMAYAAHYQWIPERPPLHDLINIRLDSTSGRVGEPVSTIIIYLILSFICIIFEETLFPVIVLDALPNYNIRIFVVIQAPFSRSEDSR